MEADVGSAHVGRGGQVELRIDHGRVVELDLGRLDPERLVLEVDRAVRDLRRPEKPRGGNGVHELEIRLQLGVEDVVLDEHVAVGLHVDVELERGVVGLLGGRRTWRVARRLERPAPAGVEDLLARERLLHDDLAGDGVRKALPLRHEGPGRERVGERIDPEPAVDDFGGKIERRVTVGKDLDRPVAGDPATGEIGPQVLHRHHVLAQAQHSRHVLEGGVDRTQLDLAAPQEPAARDLGLLERARKVEIQVQRRRRAFHGFGEELRQRDVDVAEDLARKSGVPRRERHPGLAGGPSKNHVVHVDRPGVEPRGHGRGQLEAGTRLGQQVVADLESSGSERRLPRGEGEVDRGRNAAGDGGIRHQGRVH